MRFLNYTVILFLPILLDCTVTKPVEIPKSENKTLSTIKKDIQVSTNPKVKIETSYGNMIMELRADVAPKHAANFLKLVSEKFYDGTTFHRVIPNFMVQGGDPNSKTDNRQTHGIGGPGYTIPAEINLKNSRGSVAAARQGDQVNPKRESSGSQFYINVVNNSFLDNQYTVFGQIIEGMDVADKIAAAQRDARDNPIEKISMKVTLVEEK